jgi:hypothetical protein
VLPYKINAKEKSATLNQKVDFKYQAFWGVKLFTLAVGLVLFVIVFVL